jgi:uncharacterized membrane protein
MRNGSTLLASSTGLAFFFAAACSEPNSPSQPAEQAAASNQSAPTFEVTETPPPPDVNQAAPAAPAETYTARGQEPGWLLTIAGGTIDYQGNYGEKKIKEPAPAPTTIPDGRRYKTSRLIVDITTSRCNDAMSGKGFADTVSVTADGETYRGCGGQERPDWDM